MPIPEKKPKAVAVVTDKVSSPSVSQQELVK